MKYKKNLIFIVSVIIFIGVYGVSGITKGRTPKGDNIIITKNTTHMDDIESEDVFSPIEDLPPHKIEYENKEVSYDEIDSIVFDETDYGNIEVPTKRIPVLMYHYLVPQSIIDTSPRIRKDGNTLSVENFQKQMEYIHDEGYITLTLKDVEEFVKGNKKLPQKCVLLTFDDGTLGVYEYGYPILKQYGLKATIFPITGYIPKNSVVFNPLSKKKQHMSMDQIYKSMDVFEFGSHTHAMHNRDKNLSDLEAKTEEQIYEDAKSSREVLKGSSYFCYPYGKYSDKAITALQRAGFTMAFTVQQKSVKVGDNPMLLGRFRIYQDMEFGVFKGFLHVSVQNY